MVAINQPDATISHPSTLDKQLAICTSGAKTKEAISKNSTDEISQIPIHALSLAPGPDAFISSNVNATSQTRRRYLQPRNSILNQLSTEVIAELLEYVDQFDLVNLSQTCSEIYALASARLYKRVTVNLDAEFATSYRGDTKRYISENAIKYMDSSLILTVPSLLKFISTIQSNLDLMTKIQVFVFDKCNEDENTDIDKIQTQLIDYFGSESKYLSFLHITFIDFSKGIGKLTSFLKNENVRNRIYKLFATKPQDLYTPVIPQSLTNLFLMLNEVELMEICDEEEVPWSDDNVLRFDDGTCARKKPYLFDVSKYPYHLFENLQTLTCNSNNQIGLEVLKSIKLADKDQKLRLRELTIFHLHKQNIGNNERNDLFNDTPVDFSDERYSRFMDSIDKRLSFSAIDDKVDITSLNHLCLKIDCVDNDPNSCCCFETFFHDLTQFSQNNGGLPNLSSFEVESFPNIEWLRPHQILENILNPIGEFIRTLKGLTRLSIDFSTPGFKMFDTTMILSNNLLNKLNERLMDAFFLCLYTVNDKRLLRNLKTLQLQDFLTSFIYYKPDFYESLLHTCRCWGCDLVLKKLREMFCPIFDDAEMMENDTDSNYMSGESAYYLIGYILGKLQADREVCVPIKENTHSYKNYPIYKGQAHTLHNGFHIKNPCDPSDVSPKCRCNLKGDPHGKEQTNIDNLVTTYIVHQLDPIISYLSIVFPRLDNLMIHGIYYNHDKDLGRLVPIFDDTNYPSEFLREVNDQIESGQPPDVPFGCFKKGPSR